MFPNRVCLACVMILLVAPLPPRMSPAGAAGSPEGDVRGAPEKIIRQAVWGFEFRVPGFEAVYNPNRERSITWGMDWSETNSLPDTVLDGRTRGACPMGITVLVKRLPGGGDAAACRSGDRFWSPENLRKTKGAEILDLKDRPVTSMHVAFRGSPGAASGPGENHHFFGYFIRGDHCFILQVRSRECQGYEAAAERILGSFRLLEDTGATQETAKLAQKQGGDPRDWRLHLVAGGLYLHQAIPNDPKSARRFYQSALDLGAGRLDSSDTWTAEEGIGLSYLAEDLGPAAIPHLLRGLSAAEQWGRKEAEEESLHNLLCGYSLAGEFGSACERLKGALEEVPQEDRKTYLKKAVSGDRQLKGLRGSDCYRALLREPAPR